MRIIVATDYKHISMAGAVVRCESDIEMQRTSYIHATHQDVEDVNSELQLPYKSVLLVLIIGLSIVVHQAWSLPSRLALQGQQSPTTLFNVQRAFNIEWQGIIAAAVASLQPHGCSDIHVKYPPAV